MNIRYHGHSCIQITNKEYSLIIDPFITHNPSAQTKIEDIKVQYVLLTHGHFDHIADAVEIAKRNDATIIATFELASYMSWQGVKTHPMNLGGAYTFDFGTVKLTHAFHSSSMIDENEGKIVYLGMPAGFLLTIEDKTIYHAGDTGLFGDMKMLGEQNDIDLAFLPIGDNFTMGIEDALVAAEWLRAKYVIPVHYDTFPLIEVDVDTFITSLHQKQIGAKSLKLGETFSY